MNNMFEWIKDMNWPGAFDIYARIKRMNVDCIMENYIYAIKIALKYQDINWLDYLSGLIENPEVYKLLPEEYQKLMTKYYNDFGRNNFKTKESGWHFTPPTVLFVPIFKKKR